MKPALFLVLALTTALAACGEEKKASAARTAEGEILDGSVSDAMLPLDTVRSQAPLAPKAVESESGESGDAKPSSAAKADRPKEAASSEPASEAPAPETPAE